MPYRVTRERRAGNAANESVIVERVALAEPSRDLWNHPMDSNMSTAAFMHRYGKKETLDRYARVACTYTSTHVDTMKRPRFSPVRVVVPLGFLVVSHSKSRLRDRSMSSLLCRALIEAHGVALRFVQSSKYQVTDMLKNRARINRHK